MARASSLVVFAVLLAAANHLAEAAAPRAEWTTIVTPRFRIHYHEGLQHAAREVSSYAEEVLDQLVRIMAHEPRAPIHVVMTDETDNANGFAFVLPENMINLYPAVPDSLGSLADYDDFMRLLFTHELMHVVHLDTIGGIAVGVNAIFGKVLAPNQIQPRWFIEGIAVYAESRLSSGGRVRNPLIDMFLREDVIADRFLKIDEITTQLRRFPGGGVQWEYGGRFLDFIARHYGEEALTQISLDYGSRIIPYALNVVADQVTGKTYLELWDEWRAEEEQKTLAVLERVRAEGLRDGDRFPNPSDAEEIYHPTFGPNGELAFFAASRSDDGVLTVLAPDLKTRILTTRTTGGSGAITRDGKYWVGVFSDSYRQRFQYFDLEIIDLYSGERRRRTLGARLEEPDVSIDGLITAVHQNAGRTALVLLPVEGDSDPEVLFEPGEKEQLFAPRFSPDGTQIAATLQHREGGRSLILIDARTGDVEALTHTRARDMDPVWSPDGATIYFSSDRGGIFNIYSVELASREVRKLTNMVTGAIEPAIHPNGEQLYFVAGVFGGWELRFIDLKTSPPFPADPDPLRPAVTATVSPTHWPEEQYSPWETLLPKTWSPNLTVTEDGSVYGFSISGADATNHHSYRFATEFLTENDRLGFNFSYTNRTLPTPIYVVSSLFNTRRPGSFVSESGFERPETIFRIRSGIDIPLDRWDAGHGFSISYGVELRRGARIYSDDPFQMSPSPGDADSKYASLNFSWRFSNLRSYSDSHSIAAGHSFGLGIDIHDPRLGSDFRILTMSGSWHAFYTMPWLEHHVLATRISVGGAAGDARGRAVYVLGGLEPRNIITDALDDVRAQGDALRGYPLNAIRGGSYYLLTAEYRFPIFSIERGAYTFPIYLDRLYGAVFSDAGDTPAEKLELKSMRVGTGAELRFDLTVGYYLPITMRLGFARGWSEGGIDSPYLVLGGLF